MIEISFDNENFFTLLHPITITNHRVELYFSSDSSYQIDCSKGFCSYITDDSSIRSLLDRYPQFKYKWNVLTNMDNGIVLTDDPSMIEVDSDHFEPLSSEEIEVHVRFIQDILLKEDEESVDRIEMLEERVNSLEKEIKDLRELLTSSPYITE